MKRPSLPGSRHDGRAVAPAPALLGDREIETLQTLLDAVPAPLEPLDVSSLDGFLHAASVLVLADTACGYACIAHLPDGAKNFTTIELKSNFLGTTREGTMRAECRAEHLGRTTHVWSATVFGPNDRKLALFRCTQMVLS